MAYKEDGRWRGCVRFTPLVGKQIRRTQFFDKKEDAVTWERETTNALRLADMQKHKDMDSVGRIMLVGNWAEKYLDYAKSTWSDKTFDDKKLVFKCLFSLSIKPTALIADITPVMALEHLSKINRQKTGNTANRHRKNLVAAWNWAIKYYGFDRTNPFQIVDRFPEDRHPRYVPPFQEFVDALEAANEYEQLVLLVAFFTAARKSELFRIKWNECDFEKNTVGLWTRKRQNADWEFDKVPMAESLRMLLEKHRQKAGNSEYLFDQTHWMVRDCHNRWLIKLCKKVGIKPFGFHGIRHLAASIGVDEGATTADVQQLLRHKSLTTTARYVHRTRNNNAAVKVLNDAFKDRHGLFE